MKNLKQTIRFEAERDPAFADEIIEKSGCDRLRHCIQCGTCSGACPLSIYMEHTPRQIIAMTRDGFKKEVLKSNSIWLCASCYACRVECPKKIKVTDIMYALKRTAIQEGIFPDRFPLPVLAKEFFKMVRNNGRINESLLGAFFFARTNPLKLPTMSGMGWNLLRTGRFSIKPECVNNIEDVRKLIDSVSEKGGKS
jgi:heterodisulfide reductase subunit C